MTSHLFSVKSESFSIIEPSLEEYKELSSTSLTSVSDAEADRIVHRQVELEQQIISSLIKSGEKYETLDEDNDDHLDTNSVDDTLELILEKDSSLEQYYLSVEINPENTKKYWVSLKPHLLEIDAIYAAARKRRNKTADFERFNHAIVKWSSVLQHAAEHGNWFLVIIVPD